MNFAKRACLYLIRKKGKTIILLAFLLAMATMMLTCISIQSATKDAAFNVRKGLMGSFTVNAKHLEGGLTEEVLHQILSIDGLSGNYTLRSYTQASLLDKLGDALEIEIDGAASVPEGFEHAGKIVANSNSEKDTYFTEAGFQLVEGNAIISEEKGVVLIHEDFAKRNHLSIGDTMMLGNIEDKKLHIEVTVKGIFTNTKEQDSLGIVPSYDLYENIVFTDINTCSYLLFADFGQSCQYGDFYMDDPEELDAIMEIVKAIPDVSWQDCVITKYDKDYQNARDALVSLQDIVYVAIVVITAICFIILSLLLIFRLRNRVYEMGVLLAMGISKSAILMQQLMEVLIVAAFAFVLAFVSSSFIAQQVGDSLLSQTISANYETVDLTNSKTKNKSKEETNNMAALAEVKLAEIKVSISIIDYVLVWIAGILICVISTTLAIIPILRMKPKNILTQMS